ncbi:GNAT family N-acetyltransferase [Streptomyces sp. NPDC048606]|uniref:GNAT family N-acetyltransferase n=1 Tax=Streptomyces sp. NPDC048606 TaxID=3154726 RepID=UPI0034384F04
MTWTFSTDPAAFPPAARRAVNARPVVDTHLVTVLDTLERRGPHAYGPHAPLFGWWTDPTGAVTGALVRTPPFPLLLGVVPEEAVRALGAAFTAEPLLADVDAVNARRADAEVLAASWGAPARVTEENRLFRLAALADPDPAPDGRARTAVESDLPLLLEWARAFDAEIGSPAVASEAALRERISYGGALLWERDGAPRALAAFSRPVGSVARVQLVYTPPRERRHGYAAGIAHATSRAAYAAGAQEVVLFTDLANPTSNGVYRRLGFTPVEDRVRLERG